MSRPSPVGGGGVVVGAQAASGAFPGGGQAASGGVVLPGAFPPNLLLKAAVLPASRLVFPARPGFRAGRRKLPFVATTRLGVSPAEQQHQQQQQQQQQRDSGESASDSAFESPSPQMALEPDAALELVRNWNKCLQVIDKCLGPLRVLYQLQEIMDVW